MIPAAAPRADDPAALVEGGAACVLVRHGETAANVPPYRFQGRTDEPLNDRGRLQARSLATAIDGVGFEALWSSDLSRALATAEALAARLGLEISVDARLSESDRGEWEGRQMEDVAAEDPETFAAWREPDPGFRFPGGESLVEHRDRARAAIGEILEGRLPALVVTHGGTIRCLLEPDFARFHELTIPNCSAFGLDRAGEPVRT